MKPHFQVSAAPMAGLAVPNPPMLGGLPAKVLGGTPSVCCRTRADIVAPGHFSASASCVCSTAAAMA